MLYHYIKKIKVIFNGLNIICDKLQNWSNYPNTGPVVMIPACCATGPDFNIRVGCPRIFKIDFHQQKLSRLSTTCKIKWEVLLYSVFWAGANKRPWTSLNEQGMRKIPSLIISSVCLPLVANHVSWLNFRSVALRLYKKKKGLFKYHSFVLFLSYNSHDI